MNSALATVVATVVAALALSATATFQAVNSRSGKVAEAQPPAASQATEAVRFSAVDVFVDSGAAPLAAYQFELKVTAGDVALVGVEGGEHRAFRPPPYYDPRALAQQRIVVAAFDPGSDLPRGRTRVARLMVRVTGPAAPAYEAAVVVAASGEARPIPATISVAEAVSGAATEAEGAQR